MDALKQLVEFGSDLSTTNAVAHKACILCCDCFGAGGQDTIRNCTGALEEITSSI